MLRLLRDRAGGLLLVFLFGFPFPLARADMDVVDAVVKLIDSQKDSADSCVGTLPSPSPCPPPPSNARRARPPDRPSPPCLAADRRIF